MDNNMVSTRWASFRALVWLNFIKALLTLMDVSAIDLRKTLLLYFIFKEQDVRKTVKVAQLQ